MLGDHNLVILRNIIFCDHLSLFELLIKSQEAPRRRRFHAGWATWCRRLSSPRKTCRAGYRASIASQRRASVLCRLFELAAVSSMFDPSTETTVPQHSGMYGHPKKITAFQDELRSAHLRQKPR